MQNQDVSTAPHVLITGASSGIGAALALAYAAPGARLALFGRDEARLRQVAEACLAKGARVAVILAEVTDAEVMRAAVLMVDDAHPLDLVIANAGVSGAVLGDGPRGDGAGVARIFEVNVMGVLYTVEPLLPRLTARGRGRVALMSSLASFVNRPGTAAYSASKAAVRIWGEGLAVRLAAHGVGVSVICPGFVDTPLTRKNRFPMPMLMGVEEGARVIKRGLDAGRARIAFPWPMYVGARLAGLFPAAAQQAVTARWPGKE